MDTVRKIMVEVTPEEYRKIIAGALNISSMSTSEIVSELIRRSEDKKIDTYKDYRYDKHVTVVEGSVKLDDKAGFNFTFTTRE